MMEEKEALAVLTRLANSTGDCTVPTEDVIDIAQAALSLFRLLLNKRDGK